MFKYPYGNKQQLNLNWFITKFKELLTAWEDEKADIDGALQDEIDRAEAALSDVFDARDTAIAAKNDAVSAKNDAVSAKNTATSEATAAANSATAANNSKIAAAASETNAGNSATAAANSNTQAGVNKFMAEAWAVGTMNGTPVGSGTIQYENNAKYYADQTSTDATNTAADAAQVAEDKATVRQDKDDTDTLKNAANAAALRSEGYAVGKQNGTTVASDSPYYHNNAEYYKDLAEAAASGTDGSAAQAMIAGAEATSTASAAHATGTFFRLNGVLYEATSDIAIGDTITAGTNCRVAVIGDELTAQSDRIDDLKSSLDGSTYTFSKTYMSANKYSTNRIYNARDYNIGKNLSNIYNAATSNAFSYMLDVTLSKTVSFPVGSPNASTDYGCLAFDKNDICVWVHRNTSGTSAGDVVTVTLPDNAVKMLLVFPSSLNSLGTEYTVTLVTKNAMQTIVDSSNVTDHLAESNTITISGSDFEYGSLTNGISDGSKYVVHTRYIPVDKGDIIWFDPSSANSTLSKTFYFYYDLYDWSKTFVSDSSTFTSIGGYKIGSCGYVRIALRATDYYNIPTTDFNTIATAVSIKSDCTHMVVPSYKIATKNDQEIVALNAKVSNYAETYNYDTKAETFDALFNDSGASDAFIFFTDPHLLSEGEKSAFYDRFMNYTGVIGGFFKRLATSFVLCAGDWLEWSDTPNLALYKLNLMTGRMRELFGDHYYPALGNHDTNEQGTEVSGIKRLSFDTLRNVMFPYQSAMYYSFKTAQSRFYVLNSGTDQNGNMSLDDRWDQIAWLGEQLAENDDAHSAICMHILWALGTSEDITPFADNVQELVGAYNDHSTIELNSVTYDFTNCTGKVGFILGGHLHKDQSDTTSYSVPIIASIHTRKNANYPSFDLVLVDWTANEMNMVRVGYGSNQKFTLA